MSKTVKNKLPVLLSLIILIGLGIGLRLWHLEDLFHFTYDEEIIAFVGKRMFVNRHIPLIGGVTPMHVHLSPYFYWLSGILLYISRLDPLGWGVVAAILAGLTMIALYFLGKNLFGIRAGLIAVFLYSFSFYQNIFDRHYWGLAFDGIISLLVLISLFQIVNKKKHFTYLLVVALAFGFHTDPSTLVLFVLTCVSWWIFKIKISSNTFLGAIFIFILTFMPLFVFDIKHSFTNSQGIFKYVEELKQGRRGVIGQSPESTLLFIPRALARTLYVFGDTNLAKQYSYCPQHVIRRLNHVPFIASVGIFILIGILIFSFIKSDQLPEQVGLKLILLFVVSLYIGISIYGLLFKGDLFDHYLATLFPVFFISVGYVLARLSRKLPFLVFIVLGVIVCSNVRQLLTVKHEFGYADKVKAVKWAIATVGDNDFSLDVLSSCFRYNGYRYLFYLFGKEPVKSYVDANFTYLYDTPPATTHPKYLIVLTNPDNPEAETYWKEYTRYKTKLITSSQFGTIEVLVVDNSQLDFVGKF